MKNQIDYGYNEILKIRQLSFYRKSRILQKMIEKSELIEEVTIKQVINKCIPRIHSTLSLQKSNILASDNSLEYMNHILLKYLKKESDLMQKKHVDKMKVMVRRIYRGLIGYSKKPKTMEHLFTKTGGNYLNLLEGSPLTHDVCLERKYNIQLSIKCANLKQTQEIIEQKQRIKDKKLKRSFYHQPLVRKMNQNFISQHHRQRNKENTFPKRSLHKHRSDLNICQYGNRNNQSPKCSQNEIKNSRKERKTANSRFDESMANFQSVITEPHSKSTLRRNNQLRMKSIFSTVAQCQNNVQEDKKISIVVEGKRKVEKFKPFNIC